MRYVALLRGINVGGKALIRMAELRECVAALGLDDVSTFIASGNVHARIVSAIPEAWAGDPAVRANVAFARRGTDAAQVVAGLDPDPAIDEVIAVDGAILWATRRDALNRSAIRKLLAGAAYKELTIRNLNTTLRLRELLG